ncbi:MAG TPA: pentapeptide repeat-containing protein [Candidatus Eremiobacteraceae bacterium]|nr:pentapeptide repeat-containing protein [Candidatus Eremiobacteraceae bacterium]
MPAFQTLASIAAALGHALLDGVWLGALLAGLLAVGLRFLKAVNAASRHAIWYAAIIAIAAMPAVSFGWSVAHASASAPPTNAVAVSKPLTSGGTRWVPRHMNPPTAAVHATTATTAAAPAISPAAKSFAPALQPISISDVIIVVVAILGAGSLAGIVGILLSLARLLAVKRDSRPFDTADEVKLLRWSERPSDGRDVSLLVSQGVDVPAAVGFFHPAILVPASWPANLEADELDKIVMHEYSHLRRADDWTAFVQRVAERLFWFNPAMRYIASRANLEREIACDDWVVAEYTNATSYAECLWRIAQFAHMPAARSLVPAALVTRAQIVERIEHLMNSEHNALPRMRPAALLAIVPLAVALLVIGVVRAPAITLPAASVARATQSHHVDGTTPARSRIVKTVESVNSTPVKAVAARPVWVAVAAPAARQRSRANLSPKTVALSGLDVRSLLQACTGCDLSGKDLRNADLHGLRLSGDDMSRADLRGANLRGTNFEGVDLSGARFDNADLTNAQFSGTDLKGASWTGAKLDGLQLQGVAIDAAMLHSGQAKRLLNSCQGCDMAGLDMRNLDLHGVHLQGADLSRADLRGTNLAGASLDGVDLSNAQLDGTDLTNASLNGCNLTHVDLRNAHIQGLRLEGADLRQMKFSGLNVRGLTADGADLSGAELRQVDFVGVRMNGSDFKTADLTGAQLADGEFIGADFRDAHLDGANLQRAKLCGYNTWTNGDSATIRHQKMCASFSGASTSGADFRGVRICDWHGDNETCSAVSAADLKKYSHSDLAGAILPNF